MGRFCAFFPKRRGAQVVGRGSNMKSTGRGQNVERFCVLFCPQQRTSNTLIQQFGNHHVENSMNRPSELQMTVTRQMACSQHACLDKFPNSKRIMPISLKLLLASASCDERCLEVPGLQGGGDWIAQCAIRDIGGD